jgi:hypothetical protein
MNLDAALDAAMTGPPTRKGPACTVGAALRVMPPETADKVFTALTTPKPDGLMVSTTLLAEILVDAGYAVKADALIRHRRTMLGRQNGCACEPR